MIVQIVARTSSVLLFQVAKNDHPSDSRVREMRRLFLPHEKAGGTPEESARHRQSVQLRRMRQDLPESDEHSAAQTDSHRLEEVRLRPVRLQIEPEVESREPPSATHQGLLVQMRTLRERLRPSNGIPGAREHPHEKAALSMRSLQQVLSLQEEPDQSPENAARWRENGGEKRRETTQTRVHDLPRRFHAEIVSGDALETTTRTVERGNEALVRSVRGSVVVEEATDGAQTGPHEREDRQVRLMRQTVRQQGEPQCSSASAHRGETVRLFAVRAKVHTENVIDTAS